MTVAIGEPATTPIVRFVGPSGLDAAGLSLSLPEGAGNVSSTLVDGQIACVYFVMDGKAYALYASRLEGDFFGLDGDIVETEQITGTFSAILQKGAPASAEQGEPDSVEPGRGGDHQRVSLRRSVSPAPIGRSGGRRCPLLPVRHQRRIGGRCADGRAPAYARAETGNEAGITAPEKGL